MTALLPTLPLAFLGSIGPGEMILIASLGLLLFGKRLPEVGRGVGKAIVEFKRGLKDVDADLDEAAKDARVERLDAPSEPKKIATDA